MWAGGPGDKGLAAVPGREADFRAVLLTTLDFAVALKCSRYYIATVATHKGCISIISA